MAKQQLEEFVALDELEEELSKMTDVEQMQLKLRSMLIRLGEQERVAKELKRVKEQLKEVRDLYRQTQRGPGLSVERDYNRATYRVAVDMTEEMIRSKDQLALVEMIATQLARQLKSGVERTSWSGGGGYPAPNSTNVPRWGDPRNPTNTWGNSTSDAWMQVFIDQMQAQDQLQQQLKQQQQSTYQALLVPNNWMPTCGPINIWPRDGVGLSGFKLPEAEPDPDKGTADELGEALAKYHGKTVH